MPAKGRGRGRGRKATKVKKVISPSKKSKFSSQAVSDEDLDDENLFIEDDQSGDACDNSEKLEAASIDIEEDISKLEAPTFTTIDRGPPEPLHHNTKLRWDHKVNLIGEKVLNPLLHCCEKCLLPILIYGRMIPCKHVFCLDCGKASENACPRCHDKVTRVEHSSLGTVYMCMYGGSRYGYNGCRRTYLSQRDLQAHINHRHLRSSTSGSGSHHKSSPKYDQTNMSSSKSPGSLSLSPRDPRHQTISQSTKSMQQLLDKHHAQSSSNSSSRPTTTTAATIPQTGNQTYSTPIPVMSTRTNLITVPIQDHSSQSSLQPVGIPSTDYVAYGATPVAAVSQVTTGVTVSNYQMQVNNPYVRTPIQHPTVPVSYPTIPPSTYSTPISSSQVLSFSQPPPAHPTHMPPPPMHNPAVPVQQIYNAPPPSVQRPSLNIPPSRPTLPLTPQRYPTAQYEEARVGSPSYQWQGTGPPPRGVSLPPRTTNYRPPYYH